jgi:hypothetical protein
MAPKVWEIVITECKCPVEIFSECVIIIKVIHAGRRKFTEVKIISSLMLEYHDIIVSIGHHWDQRLYPL